MMNKCVTSKKAGLFRERNGINRSGAIRLKSLLLKLDAHTLPAFNWGVL